MFHDIPLVATAAFALIVSGAVMAFALAYVAWRYGETPAGRPYTRLMVASGAYCGSYALVMASPSFQMAQLLSLLVIGAYLVVTIQWLRFTAAYTGYDDRLSRKVWVVIWLEAAVYFSLAATNRYHELLFTDGEPAAFGSFILIHAEVSWLVWLQVATFYVIVLVGYLFLIVFYVQTRSPFRRQAGAMIGGSLIVTVGNLLFLAGLSPHPDLDLTPIFFVGSGIVIWWALYHYDFLSITPIASDTLLDEMSDPVVVLDEDDVLVDCNPAAEALFGDGNGGDAVVGESLEAVVPGLLEAMESGNVFVAPSGDVRTDGGTQCVYDPECTPFHDHHDIYRGRLVVLRDVTVRKRREETLEALQSATRKFIEATDAVSVAKIAVETADEVLDHPYAGVMFHDSDDDVLRPAVLTDALESHIDGDFVVSHGSGVTWDVFESGECRIYDSGDDEFEMAIDLPIEKLLLLPLGEHGIFGVGSPDGRGSYTDDDIQFATLLSTATETALERLGRETELRESQRRLAERTEQIEFFNSILRHDILNGLMVVRGNADLLEDHVDTAGEAYLNRVQEWGTDMTVLTKRTRSAIDALTDIDAETLETVDLSAAVERKVAKVRNTYESVSIVTDIDVNLQVRGDDLINEVIENVLLNAVEHNDTEMPTIAVTASRTGDEVTLRIADDGPGIPDELKETVFERDVTTDAGNTLGFGLYFVKLMMDRYGGRVRFENNDPSGAVAVLEFVCTHPVEMEA